MDASEFSAEAIPSELSGETILITGGAGFIGSHIADAVAPDNTVRILDDFSTGSRENVPDDAEVVEGDVRDGEVLDEAMAGVDLVFHEAAVVSVQRSTEQPALSHEVNVEATIQLLERAREEDARVVAASSSAIYGEPESVPIPETAPKTPSSPYGLDKLSLDHYLRLYHDLYDLDTVALRYFNVYGPRQTAGDYSGVISIFRQQATDGEPLTVDGDGTQTRDFVHVSDVVQANLLAATTDRVGEAFNVGTGSSISIRELAETIREVADSESEIVHTDPRPGDVEESCPNVSKASDQLGYSPTTTLAAGLESLFAE
ncbi:NAD-dependent epimerase/dehydratase family protein [Halorussus litoreus]|uniref:NAD-dependent epimerase/dehydratase family protein n=1 Tax=Halorussus litoreus TaxID=1710536 RepID=UPI000E22F6D8|nr:NAD-dependent epimerase/dehydratase family protein [Halorussus litoreus]